MAAGLEEILDKLKLVFKGKSKDSPPKSDVKASVGVATFKPAGQQPAGQLPVKWKKPEKWFSAGGVVCSKDFNRVYIRKPSNNFGPWSFPKGKIDKGESPTQAALREVEEEIGVIAELVPGGYLGTGEGDFSITHYYLMVAQRDTGKHDDETEKVELLPWAEAISTFARAGNLRDLRITARAMELVEKLRKKGKIP